MARTPKVFVFGSLTQESYARLESARCEIELGNSNQASPQGNDEKDLIKYAAESHAMIGSSVTRARITREVMEASDELRVVAKCTVGVYDIDVDAASELGILVCNSPTESIWGAVAEYNLALLLTMLKRTRERDRHVRDGGWNKSESTLLSPYVGAHDDNYPGLTIGIVGLGLVGKRTAELLRPWKVRCLGYDPYVDSDRFRDLDVEPVDLPPLLGRSDVVSVNVLLTEGTTHLLGADQFAAMKPGAYFLNTSRGQVVDEAALCAALDSGRLAGAALDVFGEEPLPAASPLLQMGDKVLLSPHMGGDNTGGGLETGMLWVAERAIEAIRGEVPKHVVNPDAIPRWSERFRGKAIA